jgi:hypothetical protein
LRSYRKLGEKDLAPAHWQLGRCAIDEQATPVGCALIDEQSVILRVQTDKPARLQVIGATSKKQTKKMSRRALSAWAGLIQQYSESGDATRVA